MLWSRLRARRLVTVAMVFATLGVAGAPAIAPATPVGARSDAPVVALKTCSAGYKHAVIGGKEKCLRRGQYCSKRYKSQYRRYGFRCVNGRLK